MSATIGPWEVGSEFHWMNLSTFSDEAALPTNALQYSCGRSALAGLIKFGMASMGWKRLWIPTYYCPEVVDTVFSTGIEVAVYFDTPFDPVSVPVNINCGDAILLVNFFGMKAMDEYAGIFQLGIPIIEDHSHDPWSPWAKESRADYSIVSYRKTLPIPDGGAVWSSTGSLLPAEPVENDRTAAEVGEKIEAMLLKTIYLAGGISDKMKYLALYDQAKERLAESTVDNNNDTTAISAVSKAILNIFPWRSWRTQRLENYRYLRQKLIHSGNMGILECQGIGSCPFMLTLQFSSRQKRDMVKEGLIERSIYPAIIWRLDGKNCNWAGKRAVELSGRILSIHCDGRYSLGDMDRVAVSLSELAGS